MANFTLVPSIIITEEPEFDTLVSPEFSGLELRRSKRDNPIRRWTLVFSKYTQAELDEARDFFAARKGNYEHFTWTNPLDNVEYYVVFDSPKISYNFYQYDVYDFEFVLKEVFYYTTTTTTSTSTTTTSTTSTSTTTTSTSTTSTSTTSTSTSTTSTTSTSTSTTSTSTTTTSTSTTSTTTTTP